MVGGGEKGGNSGKIKMNKNAIGIDQTILEGIGNFDGNDTALS